MVRIVDKKQIEFWNACCTGATSKVEALVHAVPSSIDINTAQNWKRLKGNRGHIGFTALMNACFYNHAEIVALLLNNGALVDQQANNKVTALMTAASVGHTTIATILLDFGADLEIKNASGHTAFRDAFYYGHLDTAEMLLSRGADINTQDFIGETALHWSAKYHNIVLCNFLVEHGAELDIEDYSEQDIEGIYGTGLEDEESLTRAEVRHYMEILRETRGRYLERKRLEDNWSRRSAFILMLRGSGYRPSALQIAEQAAAQNFIDTSLPIAPTPRDHGYLLGQVFAFNPRTGEPPLSTSLSGELRTESRAGDQDRKDLVELIASFI